MIKIQPQPYLFSLNSMNLSHFCKRYIDLNFLIILRHIYLIHIRIIHFPKESELFCFLRGFYLYFIVLNNGEFGNTLSLTCLWRFNGTIRGIFIYLKGNTDIWKNLHDDIVLDYKSCVQWTVKKICTINV